MFSASLVVVLLVILALPLGHETRGQLLSLFGIVVSATIALGSSTLLGNAMAGIMLKVVRNFRSGDFVSVGESFGRVSERGLFHTEIQTPDRDLVTLPNLYLATTPVRVVRSSGTIVSATCSLGYDVNHTRVEELLRDAADTAGLTEPFVQVLDLGDFSVTYKVAGLLKEVKSLRARYPLQLCTNKSLKLRVCGPGVSRRLPAPGGSGRCPLPASRDGPSAVPRGAGPVRRRACRRPPWPPARPP